MEAKEAQVALRSLALLPFSFSFPMRTQPSTENKSQMRFSIHFIALVSVTFLIRPLPVTAVTVNIDTVLVGNPGNTGEPSGNQTSGGAGPNAIVGSVSYEYRIAKYEVTNAQYAAFLNEKAKTDPFALYGGPPGYPSVEPGIIRSGQEGSYTYTVKANMGNKPVYNVSWYSAIRFANWLNNGQGNSDTESGTYELADGDYLTRNAGTTWWLPSEDEWYKAAYYDPSLNNGAGGYWDYPTRSNSAPALAQANGIGDISNPGSNVANYNYGAGTVTTVGSAGLLSESYYGTSDQGGNVSEWNETRIRFGSNPPVAGLRGGSFGAPIIGYNTAGQLRAAFRMFESSLPDFRTAGKGFRVATIPEPSSVTLAAFGIVGIVAHGWRQRKRWVQRPV